MIAGFPEQPGRDGYVVVNASMAERMDPPIALRHDEYLIVRECVFCKQVKRVLVTGQGLWAWEHGEFVQKAFPDLDPGDRELLVSGVCDPCFNDATQEPEEGCPDCGNDTVIDDPSLPGAVVCASCGWRP